MSKPIKTKMMDCKKVNNNLLAYLDNEIDVSTRKQFDEHLSACTNCRTALSVLEMVYREIDSEKEEFEHNHFLGAKIWNKLQSKESTTAPVIPLRRISIAYIAAAGVFLGVALGTFLSGYIFEPNQTNTEQTWNQLAEEYFPSDLYEPYTELNENSK